LEKI